MQFTVDIDTGGTFTDGFVTSGNEVHAVKTPTTPHDLTICFMECIKLGARQFGKSLPEFLENTSLIRFSNTIGTNSIIQRDGSKLGLIMTAGREGLAPTRDAQGKRPLVEPDMVRVIVEEVSGSGEVRTVPDASSVLEAAQFLIDRGARCLVVALSNSDANPANEQLVREIVKREYPRHYLGAVPVFLASDISARSGDLERINTAILNAYIHAKLTRLLYKAGEDLRSNGYRGHLFIGHNNGSVARVAKTRAINTYNSGPSAGILGAKEIGSLYGASCVVSGDMGGTSFDVAVIRDGEPEFALRPDVEGFQCNLPMLSLKALGAGGGSIAQVIDGRLQVGPQSAGAMPGPACFGLGGVEPTVTDANLVLGRLDADHFLGGVKKLSLEKAREAIEGKVARPLGVSVERAAHEIVAAVERQVADEMAPMLDGAGRQDPLMVVYGGAGPLHSCGIAEQIGIRRLVITPFSAVFSAFSSSLMDVGHLYYRRAQVSLTASSNFEQIKRAVDALKERAEQDMRGEGFAPESLDWALELIVHDAHRRKEAKVTAAPDFHRDAASLAKVIERAREALGEGASGEITTSDIGLFARAKVPHFELAKEPVAGGHAGDAIRAQRKVLIDTRAVEVAVYDRNKLGCGHELTGPALVESEQTTVWVPAGWALKMDERRNALLQKV